MGKLTQQWPDLAGRRNSLRLQRFDYSSSEFVYFLTLRARNNVDLRAIPCMLELIQQALLWRHTHGYLRLYAYCLMPDHLHLALSPLPLAGDVPRLMQVFKSYTTRRSWALGHKGGLWQRSYYDHIARTDEDCRAICEYILDNPVRKGLVTDAEAWPYSGLVDALPG